MGNKICGGLSSTWFIGMSGDLVAGLIAGLITVVVAYFAARRFADWTAASQVVITRHWTTEIGEPDEDGESSTRPVIRARIDNLSPQPIFGVEVGSSQVPLGRYTPVGMNIFANKSKVPVKDQPDGQLPAGVSVFSQWLDYDKKPSFVFYVNFKTVRGRRVQKRLTGPRVRRRDRLAAWFRSWPEYLSREARQRRGRLQKMKKNHY